MKVIDRISKICDDIASVICVAFVVFLTVLIGVNVVARYVLNSPISWQYEVTLLCLSWVTFIGMSITFRQDEHMRLTFVANAIPESIRPYYIVVMDLITLAFIIISGYLSIAVVQNAVHTTYQTIPVSRMWFYLPYPIACVFSTVHLINNICKRIATHDATI